MRAYSFDALERRLCEHGEEIDNVEVITAGGEARVVLHVQSPDADREALDLEWRIWRCCERLGEAYDARDIFVRFPLTSGPEFCLRGHAISFCPFCATRVQFQYRRRRGERRKTSSTASQRIPRVDVGRRTSDDLPIRVARAANRTGRSRSPRFNIAPVIDNRVARPGPA